MSNFVFQVPWAIAIGGSVVVAVMVWTGFTLQRRRVPPARCSILMVLRALFLVSLILLAARPVWNSPDREEQTRNKVVLLIDRSESMSVREGDESRYQQAVNFARDVLLPTVDQSQLEITPILFSDDSRQVTGNDIATAKPNGPSTNLGRAILKAVLGSEPPPLVAITLTDGITTQPTEHSRAVAALVTSAVPMVGIGFGSQAGGRVVSLEDATAPSLADPGQTIRVSAKLNATGKSIPPLQLLLMRDGQLIDQRRIDAFDGPRTWTENFDVTVDSEATHAYEFRLLPPTTESFTLAKSTATAIVRVTESKEIRVLYVQGGLTWDYKFANIAVSSDPAIRLSGLSRTANTSKFFENVQSDVDLVGGFPNSLEKLSEFRVVVLSNLRPGDLTPFQQQLLADFCGDLGGGLLMIGGPQTFNASWRESRLEELLPVRFAVLSDRSARNLFQLQPTSLALQHPVFQISDKLPAEVAWREMPRFTSRASVEEVKPGAETWLEDENRSVLMASQRYGNGFASVICMQNLWRWRLARESNPEHFDRFWLQLLRYLAESGREVFTISTMNLAPVPGERIELLIDHRAATGSETKKRHQVRLLVQDAEGQDRLDQRIDIEAGNQATAALTADATGVLTATLYGAGNQILASRNIEVRDAAVELANTSRNMEMLRQFAGISGGVAVKAESITNAPEMLQPYLNPQKPRRVEKKHALPAGINGWILTLLLTCVSLEWIFRQRWKLI
ncbi:MAG: vWA domain-containing protein [Planctomycetota bacterium]|nr:vWA domain-containing protein [Planctomycetota bacterium]